ncbi:TOM1-like protein 6 [Silene latifolia]|uniref:TOM1-like protein 6 n=1 Tax=Silene latifolia TaxID=37657 RepID=UPI003D7836D5
MIPSLSLTSSPSSSSATVRVDKATSELLVSPDWSINMEICDLCNSNHWMAKDMLKSVKRRLQHKNPKVQLLTLTLLETMVKNCGEYIHFQIAERKILDELIKIVKKKGDMHVRDKILILLDSWQEAFGSPGGKYSQYYWACDELRRCGIRFPERPERAAPVITPPVTHQPRVPQVGFGMPSDSSQRLDEAMRSEVEGLSFSTLESMRNALELLNDMLLAVNPGDRMAVKDELIIDLVDRCRANQKKLMQLITTTTDEDLLSQGLEMNDSLQSVLAKHDLIASGAPLPDPERQIGTQQNESVDLSTKPSEAGGDKLSTANGKSLISPEPVVKEQVNEEEEEDEFVLIARRHSKTQSGPSQSGTSGVVQDEASSSGSNNALAVIDSPAPSTTTNVSKDQDLIDLLSLVLTTTSPSETPAAPFSDPVQSASEAASFNNYVAPWAQPQPQPQPQPLPQLPNQYQPMQPQTQQGYYQYASNYPPPPWETTPDYNNQNPRSNPYAYPNYQSNVSNGLSQNVAFQYPQYNNVASYSSAQAFPNYSSTQSNPSFQHSNSFQNPPPPSVNGNAASIPMQGPRSVQQTTNSFSPKASNAPALNGTINTSTAVPSGQKSFVPSYRLFEDLNVLGSTEAQLKSGPYPSASRDPGRR